MTDAHCHVTGGDPSVREFLIGRDFIGVHPWESGEADSCPLHLSGSARPLASGQETPRIAPPSELASLGGYASPFSWRAELRAALEAESGLGVGEIGLDRLKEREISQRMREVFETQLKLAIEFNRPVVLHGAKCWGQVVRTIHSIIRLFDYSIISPFLFHGFSRSDGLIPDIVALNGYISVGPAVLNDHAVNYRELVKKIPLERLLIETDRTPENAAECPSVREVAAEVAKLRGMAIAELEAITDENAERFRCRQVR